MKTLGLASLSLICPTLALAQTAFVGTWKADIHNGLQLSNGPLEVSLDGGVYTCKSCSPPISFPADGLDHKVDRQAYYQTGSAKVLDANAVDVIYKRDGKAVRSISLRASAAGDRLTETATDSTSGNGVPTKLEEEYARISHGPAGAHAISGAWRAVRLLSVSDNQLLTTYELNGSMLKMTDPLGEHFEAPLDGTDAPFHGDPGLTSVAVMKIDDHTLVETDKRNGQVIETRRLSVSPDGNTMSVAWRQPQRGRSGSQRLTRQ